MHTPPGSSSADQPGHGSSWLVLTASERGASHVAAQTANQDAVAAQPVGENGVVAAVADGHGHWRHLRSERGSRFAAAIGCEVGLELADLLDADKILDPGRVADSDAPTTASAVMALVSDIAVPAVIDRWREAVLADLASDPFTDAEEEQRQPGDDATIAYGSTLLLAVALHGWLILAQIGDGDVVGVRPDGSASLPVPPDPLLDGMVTTSLCGRDPSADFRVAVTDTSADPLLAVLLATDGYGNAQLVEAWPEAFSADLAWLLRNRDEQWLAGQLPGWAARCASSDGSADDTTVALLVSPAGLSELAATPPRPTGSGTGDPDFASEDITIPALLRGDTVPSDQVHPGVYPIEPVTLRLPHVIEPVLAEPSSTEGDAVAAALEDVAQQSEGPDDATEYSGPREQTTFRWRPPWKTRAESKPPDSSAGADA